MKRLFFPPLIALLLSLACANPLATSATQTPAVLADSFFFAHVFLDSNNNGVIDSTDVPLEGALFTAQDANGLNGGGISGKDGSAQAWWPAGSQYPVSLKLTSPQGSNYVLIGSDTILLNEGNSVDFLFQLPQTETGAKPISEQRCGDAVCDGPEKTANCPQDCPESAPATPPGAPQEQPVEDAHSMEPGDEKNTFWVTNPASGEKLYVYLLLPENWQDEALPTLVIIPGGTSSGGDIVRSAGKTRHLLEAGFAIITFDPDGRGKSGGEENFNGFIHQDGLAEVIRAAARLPSVDASKMGLISYSYGITMASGALARYPDLPIYFLIDWEGPADRMDTTSGCKDGSGRIAFQPCSDNAFWAEREALTFIVQVKVPYQRVQSAQDHVQPDTSHALNMVNAALQGGVPWVRLNQYAPGQTYDPASPPGMIPEEQDKQVDILIASFAQEFFAMLQQ